MDRVPTKWSAGVFAAKTSILRTLRRLADLRSGVQRHPQCALCLSLPCAQSVTRLLSDDAAAEQWYQRGKKRNLTLAGEQLDGCLIPAGAIFSFWKQVGRASEERGYQLGRMLQEGCMVPSIGGGLCQLSNALYQVAVDSGCEIVERHAHSRVVPGSATSLGRDATVAWNYVDLRFRVPIEMQLAVKITNQELVVGIYADRVSLPAARAADGVPAHPIDSSHACDSCGQDDCFRKQDVPPT